MRRLFCPFLQNGADFAEYLTAKRHSSKKVQKTKNNACILETAVLLYLSALSGAHAPIAQLDRVTDYESVGRGFESLSAYQKQKGGLGLPFIFATPRDSNNVNRNMPMAYCCHQFKNWWLPLFLPKGQKCKRVPFGVPVRKLVQKLRAGEQFLGRRRVHRRKAASRRGVDFLLFCFCFRCTLPSGR